MVIIPAGYGAAIDIRIKTTVKTSLDEQLKSLYEYCYPATGREDKKCCPANVHSSSAPQLCKPQLKLLNFKSGSNLPEELLCAKVEMMPKHTLLSHTI